MRSTFVDFSIKHPKRKFRHEKPDIKLLLERKETSYVDVAQAEEGFRIRARLSKRQKHE